MIFSQSITWKKVREKIPNFPIAKEIIREYCEITTIHGLHFIADLKRTLFERISWFITFILSLIICISLILNVLDKIARTPIIVTFADKPMPIFDVPFPAITICPQNYFNENLTNIENYKITEDLVGQTCPAMLNEFVMNEDNGGNLMKNLTYDFESWSRKLKANAIETFIYCELKYEENKCIFLVSESYTANGLCFTLNRLKYSDIFRENVVVMGIDYAADIMPNLTWSLDDGYKDPLALNYPKNEIGGIVDDSYIFVLNQSKINGKLCSYSDGFQLYLHSPNDMPMHKGEFIKLPCGEDIRLAIVTHYVSTTKELISYSPQKRGCLFSHERKLKFFKIYTESNCWLECLTNYTLSNCGCSFYYMPRFNGTPLCGMGNAECLYIAKGYVQMEVISRSGTKYSADYRLDCHCLPSCVSLSYKAEVTQSPLISNQKINNDTISLTETMVVLTIFHKAAEFIPIIRSELFSITDLIANCGGLLGLFMGFSLLSLVEIVYYCTLRPLGRYLMKRKKKASETLPFENNMLHLDNRSNIQFIKANRIFSRGANSTMKGN